MLCSRTSLQGRIRRCFWRRIFVSSWTGLLKEDIRLTLVLGMNSDSSLLITDAIRELSRRAGARGTKAVVKIMYDRGHLKQVSNFSPSEDILGHLKIDAVQVVDNHTVVNENEYTGKAVNIPHPLEIPNVDLQVMNYHRPMLGTFHSKFMAVDRKIAVVSSNNIQSNDNCEMATHLEGPIVDPLYDLSLISWDKNLDPPLPLHNTPVAEDDYPTFKERSFLDLLDSNGKLRAPVRDTGVMSNNTNGNVGREPKHTGPDPHFDVDCAAEIVRSQSTLSPRGNEKTMDLVAAHLSKPPFPSLIRKAG